MNKEQALKTMKFEDLSNDELSELLWMVNKDQYKERPVTINEFIESDEFVHKKWNNVFPIWRGVLNEIYPTPFNAPYNEILISAAAGAGKAQPLDSLILTPQGYIQMKDVKLGQEILDGKGNKTIVTGIFPQGKRKCFKITFNDRTSINVSDEHINCIFRYNQSKRKNEYFNITTLELIKLFEKSPYKLRVDTPILNCWEDKDILIDPYLLGILIADGCLCKRGLGISNPEIDIQEKIKIKLQKINYHLKPLDNMGKDFGICPNQIFNQHTATIKTSLKKQLQYYDLNKKSIEKHIPKQYLFSSIETRLELLRGLMDGDGYLNTFSTSSKQLSEDFEFLVRSLGIVDTVTYQQSSYTNKSKEKIYCNMSYQHYLRIPQNLIITSSEKHKKRYQKPQAKTPIRKIVSIQQIEDQECQCIQVASTEHTYLTNNMTPTHNTVTATIGTLYDMYKLGCLKNPCEFYGLAPGTMLIMAVFSATGTTAAVNWQDITTGIEACPWMMTRIVDKRGLEKKSGSLVPVEILPGIFIQTGSKFQHSMGKAIFDGLMDEAAFGGDNLKDAVKTYNELSSRMATRFRKFSKTGNLPGHLFLISSPKEAGDFMQYRIDTAKKSNSRFTLIKQNISSWDADPRNDSDDKFTVFVGNEFKEPKIYEDGEEPSFEDLDYLIYPPKSYLDNFKQDILGAIMNYGGVTTVADTGLFKSPTVVGECMILKNPFNMNIIKLPFDANDIQLMDFMDMSYFKDIRHPECNRFIHIDVAFSSNTIDRYGLAAGYCTLADRSVIRKEGENIAEIYNRAEKMFYIDWAIGIEPVKGQEVPLSKVEEFIKYLRKIGYPIASVSADTFNSKQTLQNLEQMKFDTQSISVDRSRDPYLQLKRFIYNKQILIPNVPELKIELLKLRDSGKKIDHNINGCVIGNTKISLFGQEDTTIEELAKKGKEYRFWVDAYKDNVIIPALAYNAHLTKYVDKLITLTIKEEHKHEITCTLDHKILTPNGYKQAYDLEIEEEIVTENGIGKLVKMEINRVPKTPVYDITVPIYENFIANGIVIHNSKDISDAVAGCIWNCSQQPNKTVNIARLTASILNPNGYFNMSDEEKDIAQQMEYERLRGTFGNIFKGL